MTDYFSMFKAYDMRGTYPKINKDVYYWVGRGLIEKIFKPLNLPTELVLVRDARYTSPEFYQALVNGVQDAGGKALCLGITSTDFLYGATQYFDLPGGIVTASHNPKDDNGLKIVKGGSTMLGLENGLDLVRDFVLANIDSQKIDYASWKEPEINEAKFEEAKKYYISKLKEVGQIEKVNQLLQSQNKKIKVAVDAGNGMGGFVMNIAKDLYTNIEFVDLYWELDGNYPNHPADPQNFENMKDLQKVIADNKDIAFGFAFDGDADRVFFVDENAKIVQGDFLVAFFAKSLLEAYFAKPKPNLEPAVVYIQPGSRSVTEAIAEADGVAIPSKQGHTSIKAKMEQYKAVYGGEFSGHHYFADFGFMDSGALAAVLMIKILVLEDRKLSEIFAKLNNSYFISDLQAMKLPEGVDFEQVKAKLKKAYPDGNYSEMDGLSVFYPDWKFSIRPSNTEPVVKFIVETRVTNTVDEKLARLLEVLKS
jgi:phosphomannomutase